MRYVFADCVLDTDQYALHRAGQPSKIRPKAFEVLTYLLRHRDRVVTKQELAEQSWPDQFITNAVVENTVKAVRRAVGDSGRTQQIIQTLRGYGYRFVAPAPSTWTRRHGPKIHLRCQLQVPQWRPACCP